MEKAENRTQLSRILIVDESGETAEAISGMLNPSEYSIREVGSGIAAVKSLIDSKSMFSCVIMGNNIGELKGADVARIIRTRFKKLPLIILTRENDVASEIDVMSVANAYVLRYPFTETSLVEILNVVIGNVQERVNGN